ncbi:MAG: DNA modification system-associated small protein [Acidobacteriota bacterium]
MDHDFLEKTLAELAPIHRIPQSLIPQLVHLMREYPNIKKVYGTKAQLQRELEKIINMAVQEGK